MTEVFRIAPAVPNRIWFACGTCHGVLRAAVGMAGRDSCCPHCDAPVRVPAPTVPARPASDTAFDLPALTDTGFALTPLPPDHS